jgi:hypothetical protein
MTKNAILLGFAAPLTATISVPATAQDATATPPRVEVLQQLYDCRAITDPTARLACFDARVAAIETAEAAREIRVVDREEVRRTRRGLFGLSLPNIGSIFGGGDDENEEQAAADAVMQIEATIAAVGTDSTGRRMLILDNQQRWVQTDSGGGRSPQAGQSVVIRRGSLGSFIANVNGRPGIRVIRTR